MIIEGEGAVDRFGDEFAFVEKAWFEKIVNDAVLSIALDQHENPFDWTKNDIIQNILKHCCPIKELEDICLSFYYKDACYQADLTGLEFLKISEGVQAIWVNCDLKFKIIKSGGGIDVKKLLAVEGPGLFEKIVEYALELIEGPVNYDDVAQMARYLAILQQKLGGR